MQQRRKSIFILSIVLFLTAMLAGCGSKTVESTDSPKATATAAAEPTPSPASESLTRVYKDDAGREVEIPTHPQHVVASYYVGEILSLGIKPLGAASQFFLDTSYIKDKLAGVEQVGDNGSYDIEKILSLQPDLIIVNEFVKPEELEKLSKVAPTVTVKYAGSDVYVHVNKIADILGKTAEAKLWIEQYHAKAAKIKEQLTSNGKPMDSASVLQVMNKQLFVYFENISFTVYQTLGFTVPSKVKEINKGNETGFAKLSLEVLPDYSADHIFVLQTYGADSESFYKGIFESALWKTLPAVQNKHVYYLDSKWGYNDPISLEAQLDDVVKLLLNK